MLSSIISLMKN